MSVGFDTLAGNGAGFVLVPAVLLPLPLQPDNRPRTWRAISNSPDISASNSISGTTSPSTRRRSSKWDTPRKLTPGCKVVAVLMPSFDSTGNCLGSYHPLG